MAPNEIRLIIVAALADEARPLIRQLDLRPAPEKTLLPVHLSDHIALVVSGVGRRAAGAAVKYLTLGESAPQAVGRAFRQGSGRAAWLNVGIGGHRDLPVGQGILAHRVEDAGWSRAWYPRFAFDPPCPTEPVRTIDHVERNYLDPVVYDMEAAGFAAAASSAVPPELIHVYKVISDTPQAPVHRLEPALVEELVRGRAEEVAGIARTLVGLADELAGVQSPPPGFEEICGRWSFTRMQQYQLRRLLAAWRENRPASPPLAALREARHPREVLLLLERAMRAAPPASKPGHESS